MKKAYAILATVIFMAASACAIELPAPWNAKVDLGAQSGSLTVVLKQDGDKLTGTYSGALGDVPLTGTVKGNAVTFESDVQRARVHDEGKVDN